MNRFIVFLQAAGGLLLASWGSAQEVCTDNVVTDLSCSSQQIAGVVFESDESVLGGPCSESGCYSCGEPFAPIEQTGAEDIYSFRCQRSGNVAFAVSDLDCDLDIYVLDASCDPFSGCEAGSTAAMTAADGVSFFCSADSTYYVVIEGYEFTRPDSTASTCSYTLDVSTGGGCPEDCDNGADDDGDGDVDCYDEDCAADPACMTGLCEGGVADDADGDGVCDDVDVCPDTIPDAEAGVPEVILESQRHVWNGGDAFTSGSLPGAGRGSGKQFGIQDTRGCSCADVLEALGGPDGGEGYEGHYRFGCSQGVLEEWIESVS